MHMSSTSCVKDHVTVYLAHNTLPRGHTLIDLDEVWRALGISGCPQCLCPDGELGNFEHICHERSFAATLDIIRTVRALLQERGNVTACTKLLREYRLSVLHTKIWNPFLMVPHADVECFPQDHLHGVYVHF